MQALTFWFIIIFFYLMSEKHTNNTYTLIILR